MAKASYSYEIQEYNGVNFLVITDRDMGGTSVTNDIENVVEEICDREGFEKEDYSVVYCDSEGMWDGYSIITEQFYILQCDTAQEAMKEYIKLFQR